MTIVVSCGDVNGIGLEVFLKALLHPVVHEQSDLDLILYCELTCVQHSIERLQLAVACMGDELHVGKLRCRVVSCNHSAQLHFGSEHPDAARLAIASLELAARAVCRAEADAVLTLPISKHSLQKSGFSFPGQTEFFAARAKELMSASGPVASPNDEALMILMHERLRVALATVHVPLQSVAGLLSVALLCEKVRALNTSLQRDFACTSPRIAMLALNPHAGENGAIGRGEQEVLEPAVLLLQKEGLRCDGPFAADGFFAHGAYREYDGILAMYHDQGLIPLKLLAQGAGVNFSANLPIVRCSPDHGTAFAIAGKGIADESSTVQALLSAISIVRNRAAIEAA